MGECVVDVDPPNKLVLTYFWGLLPLCHFWRKSIKKSCDRESSDYGGMYLPPYFFVPQHIFFKKNNCVADMAHNTISFEK